MFELPEQGTVFPDLEVHELMDDDLVPVFLRFPKEIDNDLVVTTGDVVPGLVV